MYVHLCKRKQRKDKLETKKIGYLQRMCGDGLDRIQGRGRDGNHLTIPSVFWNHVNVLYIQQQKEKEKENQQRWREKLKCTKTN